MAKRRKRKQKTPIWKRLVYLLAILSGGGGVGGWAFKDHPALQALYTLATGQAPPQVTPTGFIRPASTGGRSAAGSVARAVVNVLRPRDDFRKPGVYQVTIAKVQLDPKVFRSGHTADLQARVSRLDTHGREQTLWDSKNFGERRVVVGQDELSAGWPYRPFEVEWKPGEPLVVEVFDRNGGLFEPVRFVVAAPSEEPREFPLKSGEFPLEKPRLLSRRDDPQVGRIVFRTERVADLPVPAIADDTDRPIIIK
jgi:hypothetical protein